MSKVTVGVQLIAHFGDIGPMRKAWVEADSLGVDRIYTSDHLNAIPVDAELVSQPNVGETNTYRPENVFEGGSIQAAMAVTTERAEIGCMCFSNAYRNPHMLAYMSATIDHLSGGRFVLGIGTGFAKKDFDDFEIPYGTQKERALAMQAAIPTIRKRWAEMKPTPLHDIPINVASMGEKIGLRIVAEHADEWHVYGPYELMAQKIEVLKKHCDDVGRDIGDITFTTYYWPHLMSGPDETLEKYQELGITEFIVLTEGHDNWDLGLLRETLQWRDEVNAAAPSAGMAVIGCRPEARRAI